MSDDNNRWGRRSLLNVAVAAAGATFLSLCKVTDTAAQDRSTDQKQSSGRDNFSFGRTDESDLKADDTTLPLRARTLIRIGEDGIAKENPAAMMAFFHPEFRFHGPGGAELDRDQLWAYFAACRAAFDNFTVTRQALVSDGGDYIAARTRFAGTFVRPFKASAAGMLQPNGKPFEYRPINIFRFASDGRLMEEWVQYDVQGFLAQLK